MEKHLKRSRGKAKKKVGHFAQLMVNIRKPNASKRIVCSKEWYIIVLPI